MRPMERKDYLFIFVFVYYLHPCLEGFFGDGDDGDSIDWRLNETHITRCIFRERFNN